MFVRGEENRAMLYLVMIVNERSGGNGMGIENPCWHHHALQLTAQILCQHTCRVHPTTLSPEDRIPPQVTAFLFIFHGTDV